MSLTITINNIDDLTDKERMVLRLIAGEAGEMITGTLKDTIRNMAAQAPDMNNDLTLSSGHEFDVPVEPAEVFSPHTAVIPAPPPSGSAELDAKDLPWDKRIHASSHAKVADGTWRMMRGVDAALVVQVEQELRAVQAIPVPVAPAPAEVVADVTPTPPAPAIPVPPPPPAPTGPMTFAQLMQHITPMLVSGKLTQPVLQGVVNTLGLPHLAALGARPDLVETVRSAIDGAMQ